MSEIAVEIRNRIAAPRGMPVIVCGNSSYVLRFDLREKTGRSILSASYAQQVSASDAFVLVYGSKSTSFEQYLYKKIYRAFPAGESTPSQGYALYEANSGETIRIVVTETGE